MMYFTTIFGLVLFVVGAVSFGVTNSRAVAGLSILGIWFGGLITVASLAAIMTAAL